MASKATASPLKDSYNEASTDHLASAFAQAWPLFDADAFASCVRDGCYAQLELKARWLRTVHCLHACLPEEFAYAIPILEDALTWLPSEQQVVIPKYVETYGLDSPSLSVSFLQRLAAADSMEAREGVQSALRAFIGQDPEGMLADLGLWIESPDERVRRAAAESLRPRGVWTSHLHIFRTDPMLVVPLLVRLRADESLYVRKSVANNLNDISKDNPELVLALARAWSEECDPRTDWILRQGCRTLLRAGHPAIYQVFGLNPNPCVSLDNLTILSKTLAIGGILSFCFRLVAAANESLHVDYRILYARPRGTLRRRHFRLTKVKLEEGEEIFLEKQHRITSSPRWQICPGMHFLELLVNGQCMERADFCVEAVRVL